VEISEQAHKLVVEGDQIPVKPTYLGFLDALANLWFAVATAARVLWRASDAVGSSTMDSGFGRAWREVSVMVSPTSA
jgi:hypothetical protein